MRADPLIQKMWARFGFTPNKNQRAAILHEEGPLFLPAGPGSGKTRVLLWRVTNLIATKGIEPHAIYLSTFTEKAALQLREGLRGLLGTASEYTGKPYDISRMYVGTVHSLCQRILVERQFQPNRSRGRPASLLDELDQYLLVNQSQNWRALVEAGGFDPDEGNERIARYFSALGKSKHAASSSSISFFNRISEECIDPTAIKSRDKDLLALLRMYSRYRELLREKGRMLTDFSLLQQDALDLVTSNALASSVFDHVIVDEYQDTNTVQERLFFRLAAGKKNICVVGDDDQALYRFRGATVENFVQFPMRCLERLGVGPTEIPLDLNYRSRARIVEFSTAFLSQSDWKAHGGTGSYRIESKQIRPNSRDGGPSVVATAAAAPQAVCAEIAALVRRLIDMKRLSDPNQVAFLYPSLKSDQVKRMREALEAEGLRVYAPRAASFIETAEATSMLGLFAHILGRPERGAYLGDYGKYYDWLDRAEAEAHDLAAADPLLQRFIIERQKEIARAREDYARLLAYCAKRRWDLDAAYDPATQQRGLVSEAEITIEAQRRLNSKRFNYVIRKRLEENNPLKLKYILKRASSIEWSLLDLFYQLTMFEHFAQMFDIAQRSTDPDEGPVCNLALLTQYISRFLEQRAPLIAGDLLADDLLQRMFFGSYLYALHRRGESEYEDAEDPFPKGRIPFLTIHQSKGLEFPVVVLGNPRKKKSLQAIERIAYGLVKATKQREPLDRMPEFDMMRMFYVALSRAKNLLLIANYQSQGNFINPEFRSLVSALPVISALDINSVPASAEEKSTSPKVYSYTGDFLAYERCPRQYLMFRKFEFVPSRSQTMVFGSLVHRTLDDIHQHVISARGAA